MRDELAIHHTSLSSVVSCAAFLFLKNYDYSNDDKERAFILTNFHAPQWTAALTRLIPDYFARDKTREHLCYIYDAKVLGYDYSLEEVHAILLWFFQDQNDTRRFDAGTSFVQQTINHYRYPDTSFDSI